MVPHSLYSLQNTFSNIVHRNDCLVLLYTLAFYGLPLLAVSSCLCEKIQIIDLDKEKTLDYADGHSITKITKWHFKGQTTYFQISILYYISYYR